MVCVLFDVPCYCLSLNGLQGRRGRNIDFGGGEVGRGEGSSKMEEQKLRLKGLTKVTERNVTRLAGLAGTDRVEYE